jgi:predicted O-linked N-acetylglucosamine transferase (SPINDLY family)
MSKRRARRLKPTEITMHKGPLPGGSKPISSRDVAAVLTHANDLYQRGLAAEAEKLYRQILASGKKPFEACYLIGLIEAQRGNLDDAHRLLREAAKLGPRSVEVHVNLGRVLNLLDRDQAALASYDRAIAIDPRFVLAWNNRGGTLRRLNRLDEALASYDKALAVNPDYGDALYNKGNVLAALGRQADALASYDKALQVQPGDASILIGRANALIALGRHDEAVASLNQTLAREPRNGMALHNRGNALAALQRYGEALGSYRDALAIEPDHRYAWSGLADCALFTCDWGRTTTLAGELPTRIHEGKSIIHPFTALGYCDDPALLLRCAQGFVADTFAMAPAPLWRKGKARRPDRIRIAYMSADFRMHAMSYLISELFKLHDRSRFEVHGVSLGADDASPVRARVIDSLDQFHDVAAASDGDAAALIHRLEIDIAIDLNGHTRGGRMGILARRPAPIQAAYLGFPGTSGAAFIDYLIADDVVLPAEHEPFYTEKIVRLPGSYWVDQSQRQTAERAPTRAEAGLPDRGFVFCCFNNDYKITPPIFDIWMRLLQSIDGSVLWLLRDNEAAENNLRREAAARGVDPSRLVFAERVGIAEHLARHRLADLFLDTLPVNAHTTATDALWMELPLLTCRGRAFAGRVAASVLRAIGAPELIADDLAGYEALAQRLAQEPAALEAVRTKLAHNRSHCPLFDTDRFRRHMEAALTGMWERWQRGDNPRGFNVEPAA